MSGLRDVQVFSQNDRFKDFKNVDLEIPNQQIKMVDTKYLEIDLQTFKKN